MEEQDADLVSSGLLRDLKEMTHLALGKQGCLMEAHGQRPFQLSDPGQAAPQGGSQPVLKSQIGQGVERVRVGPTGSRWSQGALVWGWFPRPLKGQGEVHIALSKP